MSSQQFFEIVKNGSRSDLELIISLLQEENENLLSLNYRNSQRYTPLHVSLFSRNFETFSLLVEKGADINLKCHGTPILHIALHTCQLPQGYEFGMVCFKYLLSNNADVSAKDDLGMTALHVACELSLTEAVRLLISSRGTAEIEVADKLGLTPLHHCAVNDSSEAAEILLSYGAKVAAVTFKGYTAIQLAATTPSKLTFKILLDSGADMHLLSAINKSALQLALENGWLNCPELTTITMANASNTINNKRTGIITHPIFLEHHTCPPSILVESPMSAPPENFRRLTVLTDPVHGALRASPLTQQVHWIENPPPAKIADILRVHEWSHVRYIQSKCEDLSSDAEDVEEGQDRLDSDTAFSKLTYQAAVIAAGSACHAVDLVCSNSLQNVFCALRPPGHHAGPRGLVKSGHGSDSYGFCFLNNVSIAAAYALNKHRDTVRRVAIVDFDVHHGNGTEETIRWLQPGLEQAEFVNSFCFGSVETPKYKPWLDDNDIENVMFVSVHGYGPKEKHLEYLMPFSSFYPGTGKTVIPDIITPKAQTTGSTSSIDVLPVDNPTTNLIHDLVVESEAAADKYSNPPINNNIMELSMLCEPGDDLGDESSDSNDNREQHDEEEEEEDEEVEVDEEGERRREKKGSLNADNEEEEGDGELAEEGDDDSDEDALLDEVEDTTQGYSTLTTIQRLRNIYQSPSKPHPTATTPAAASTHKTHPTPQATADRHHHHHQQQQQQQQQRSPQQQRQPLIFDIGISLPHKGDHGLLSSLSLEYRYQWREYMRREIFPRLLQFSPDILFISAGFDGHKKDTINCGYLALIEDDYEWLTTQLTRIANTVCNGHIVSMLEGGYQLGGDFCSAFAKSVKAHIKALVVEGKKSVPFDSMDSHLEQQIEKKIIDAEIALKIEEKSISKESRRRKPPVGSANSPDKDKEQDKDKEGVVLEPLVPVPAEKIESVATDTATGDTTTADPTGAAATGRKRRRAAAPVDYVALDLELKKKHSNNDSA